MSHISKHSFQCHVGRQSPCIGNRYCAGLEMAQQLRTLTGCSPEDLGWIFSNHMSAHNCNSSNSCNSSFRRSKVLFWTLHVPACTFIHTGKTVKHWGRGTEKPSCLQAKLVANSLLFGLKISCLLTGPGYHGSLHTSHRRTHAWQVASPPEERAVRKRTPMSGPSVWGRYCS